jgi:hypothetical protein
MRTTVDIPDPLYRQLKTKAASEGRSVKELILRSVESELRHAKRSRGKAIVAPIIKTGRPGTLDIDNAKIFEIIPFP